MQLCQIFGISGGGGVEHPPSVRHWRAPHQYTAVSTTKNSLSTQYQNISTCGDETTDGQIYVTPPWWIYSFHIVQCTPKITECLGQTVSVAASNFEVGGLRLYSETKCIDRSNKMPEYYLKLGHDHFVEQTFKFTNDSHIIPYSTISSSDRTT